VDSLLTIFQALLVPREADGTLLFWAKEILGGLLILAFFWCLAQVAGLFLVRWGRRFTLITGTELDDRMLQRVVPHISRLLLMLGAYLAIRSLPLHEKMVVVASGLLYILLVIIIFNLLYHALDELLRWYVSSRNDGSAHLLSRQMVPIAEKLMMLFLLGTALIIVLKHFHYDIFSLMTALGIGSLAIGMAAKDTLAHMISGFTLMLDRPFTIGDRIKLSNGQVGDVTDIGLRSTKIRGLDNTLMVIPNSDLCNSAVINLLRPTSVIQGQVTVGVDYGSDVERVKQVLMEIGRDTPEVVDDPPPLALFSSFGESALQMHLLFWVSDPTRIGLATDQLNCAIIRRFREEGIGIPFPVRTVIVEKE
jgi:small-conductance mechanosensitive channel